MSNWSANLGRDRTKLGSWMDRNGVSQGMLNVWSGASRSTITKLCGDKAYSPTGLIKRTIVAALNAQGFDVEEYDFW